MSEQSRFNEATPPAPPEQDMVSLVRKIQQQLVFLEKKIDILISQSSGRPFGEKHFSKPFRSSGRPFHHSDRAHVSASGEKSFGRERHFKKRNGEENRGFDRKKKIYDNFRESDYSQGRNFEKRHNNEKRVFDQKKKPFSYRGRDHR